MTRATYNKGTVLDSHSSTVLTLSQTKYWATESGVSDTIGVWDTTQEKFIPDGLNDARSGWLWPLGLDWNNYGGN